MCFDIKVVGDPKRLSFQLTPLVALKWFENLFLKIARKLKSQKSSELLKTLENLGGYAKL